MKQVYIENRDDRPSVYWVTPEKWAAACARHPDVAGQVAPLIADGRADKDALLAECEIAIASKIDTGRIKRVGRKLRWLHSSSAGVENLSPFDWLPPGAALTNSRGVHGPKVGEFGLMALLMLNDHVVSHIDAQRRHAWEQRFASPIAGRTALIVGFGNMGRAIAARARLLDMRILAVKRNPAPDDLAERVVGTAGLASVLPEADFLVVAAPLTPETRGLIGARELDLLKPGAGIVNVGRSAIMDYGALVERLRDGRIGGAILDVFDQEPLPAASPLWDVPRLLVVPHVSSDDPANYMDRALDVFFDNLGPFLRGDTKLPTQVDTLRGY